MGTIAPAAVAGLTPTPRQSRGPFYPAELPLDHDNDLTRVQGRAGVARGELTDVVGRVLDASGRPVPNAQIEIWQCDVNGRYHHPGDRRHVPMDADFQGYGATISQQDGAYRFRTIKPVAYPGRAPHIHFAVHGAGFDTLVTQMYVAGAPENEGDFLLNRVRDVEARKALIVDLGLDTESGVLKGQFDIVVAGDARLARQV